MKRYIKCSNDRGLDLETRIYDDVKEVDSDLVDIIIEVLSTLKFSRQAISTYDRLVEIDLDSEIDDNLVVHLDFQAAYTRNSVLCCKLFDNAFGTGHFIYIYGVPVGTDVDTSILPDYSRALIVDVYDTFNCINPTKAKSDISKFLFEKINAVAIRGMVNFRGGQIDPDTKHFVVNKLPLKSQIRSDVTKDLRKYIDSKFRLGNVTFNHNSMLRKSDLKNGMLYDGDSVWFDCEIILPDGTAGYYTADYVYENDAWVYHTNDLGYDSITGNYTLYNLLDQLGIEY